MADEPSVEQIQALHQKALREVREAVDSKTAKSAAAYLETVEKKLTAMGVEPTPVEQDPLAAAKSDDELLEAYDKLTAEEQSQVIHGSPEKFKRILAAEERRGARALFATGWED
jgi:hypothetical protein